MPNRMISRTASDRTVLCVIEIRPENYSTIELMLNEQLYFYELSSLSHRKTQKLRVMCTVLVPR